MAVSISKPALNLREELKRGERAYSQQQFWFTGDGTKTAFTLQHGWEPLHVFLSGALEKEGSADDYTVSYDGFSYTVTFAVAPASAARVAIIGVMA